MTINAGPNIVKDGLILHLDAANEKSFRGEPTTNLAAQALYRVQSSISLYNLGIEDGWQKYGIGGTWANGTYPYAFRIDSVPMVGGEPYSSRLLIKSNVFYKMNSLTGMNYVNQPKDKDGTSFVNQISGDTYEVGRYDFIYTSSTTQAGYIVMRPLENGTTFDENTDFVWIKEVQVENKTYNTPFVDGTRGNTVETGGGWKDLTGNVNGTLVNNPSYSSESGGVILLNGVNNYIDIPLDLSTQNHTIIGAARYVTVGGRTFSGKNNNWLMGHWSSSTVRYYASGWVSPASPYNEESDTEWRIYAAVGNYSSDLWSLYVNSNLKFGPNSGGARGPDGFYIGRYGPGSSEYSNSHIGFLMCYDRVLSENEIKQNFNATRGRYGL